MRAGSASGKRIAEYAAKEGRVARAMFGGKKVSLGGGLVLGIPGATDRLSHQRLIIQASVPVYQFLNGPQPEEDWTLSTGLHLAY